MSDSFRYYLRIRYGECDAQKVVFNARYADYVDVAMSEFMRALGYGAEMASGELDFQLVKQTLQWKASARFDQVLEIAVRTQYLGNTSVTLAFEFRIAGEEAVIATVETVYVMVDAHTLAKKALPEPVRTQLKLGAPGVTVDHAGSGR